MKKITIKRLLPITTLLLASCSQTIVVTQDTTTPDAIDHNAVWDFFSDYINWFPFGFSVLAFVGLAIILWREGHRIMKWFNKKSLLTKILVIILTLAAVFALGMIPYVGDYYAVWFALPVALAVDTMALVVVAICERKKSHKTLPSAYSRHRNIWLLAKFMAWIWSCGLVLYFIAISIGSEGNVASEVFFRSAIASLDMFLMDIDSNILDNIAGHDILKGMIVSVGFAAVICMAILILSLILSRLLSYMHLRHIRIDEAHNHLYVFFGLNEASRLLAESTKGKDPRSVIVFVDNSDDDAEDESDGWSSILNTITHRRKGNADIKEDERVALAIANGSICKLDKDTNDIWGNLGLNPIGKLLEKLITIATKEKEREKGKEHNRDLSELHIFFMSEDREENVRSSAIIARDALVSSPTFKSIIYCHARRYGINSIVEDLHADNSTIDIRIVDSSHLAIEDLKCDVRNHPVSFVDVKVIDSDNPGTVSSRFTCMVMGFGETGHEAVRFLYEYGAFVDQTASESDSRRSPFSCHILDSNMEKLEGHFISRIPNVRCRRYGKDGNYTTANATGSPYGEALLNFYPYNYQSSEFFTQVLDKIAGELNYVVVALGDDEENMTAAVEILAYVRRKRKDLKNFRIYVRAYEKGTFNHLSDIAHSYNNRLKKHGDRSAEDIIVLFGQNGQIYKYEHIVDDKFQEKGKEYYECYKTLKLNNDKKSWEERHTKEITNTGATIWENLSSIRRKESQDRSNAVHALTKVALIQRTIGRLYIMEFADKVVDKRTGERDNIDYYGLTSSKEKKLMLNMAMLEHIRWNAAHEMMGYVENTDDHSCDELRKRHNCLKPWQQLDKESVDTTRAKKWPADYKLYDFGVVETTLKLDSKSDNEDDAKKHRYRLLSDRIITFLNARIGYCDIVIDCILKLKKQQKQ